MQYYIIRAGQFRRVKKNAVMVNFYKGDFQTPSEIIIKGKVHAVVRADKGRIQF